MESSAKRLNLEVLQQSLKWLVYLCLVVNFTQYFIEDLSALSFNLPAAPTWLDWTGSFATTIDLIAWLSLIALFEWETYFLSEDASIKKERAIQCIRLVCYVAIFHTLYSYVTALSDFTNAILLPNIHSACQLADQGVTYLSNIRYTEITQSNCQSLGQGSEWYSIYNDSVIIDTASLAGDYRLARIDVLECSSWLVIMFFIELDVRLQLRGVTKGRLLKFSHRIKSLLYLLLLSICAYWAYVDHWLYAWDEFLWIAGFAAIEMNLSEWRGEIRAEH